MPQSLTFDHKIDRKRRRVSKLFGNTATGPSLLKQRVFVPSGSTVSASINIPIASLTRLWLFNDQPMGLVTNGGNEVQRASITGIPTSGTFDLTLSGSTGTFQYDSTAVAFQAELEGMASIGVGNVVCTGGPLPSTPITYTFQGALANTNIAQLSVTANNLIDSFFSTTPAPIITTIVDGGPAGDSITLKPYLPLIWFKPGHWASCPFTSDVTVFNVTNTGPVSGRLIVRALFG